MGFTKNHDCRFDGAKRESDLRKAEKIVLEDISDYEKAVKLRRVFSSSKLFKSKYFVFAKEEGSYYNSKLNSIMKIYEIIERYELIGLYQKAKEEDKFKLKSTDYKVDARDIITSYVLDFNSYKTKEFIEKHHISKDNLYSCANIIKNNDKKLYDRFQETDKINETKRLTMPIFYLNEIREGIKTGTTSDGKPFDIYEFWRLNPFKTENIEIEIKAFFKMHENFKRISQLNQKIYNEEQRIASYRDFICNFIEILGFDTDHTIKNYMIENEITSCNFINKEGLINNSGLYTNEDFNQEDLKNVIDYMELEDIPFVEHAFKSLRSDYIKNKKVKYLQKELTPSFNYEREE